MKALQQTEMFPTSLHLRRDENARGLRRVYFMTVQLDLWGGATLVREWSQAGASRRIVRERFGDEGRAIDAIAADARRMAAKGYRSEV